MWYIIILGVLALLVAAFFYLKKKGGEQKQEAINEVLSRFSGKELNEKEKRGLAYGAILATAQLEDTFSLLPDTGLSSHIEGLADQWSIVDRESAKERIEKLLELTTSSSYDQQIAEDPNSDELQEIYKNLSKELKIPLEQIEQVKTTYAWDIGRASPLIKWCFWIGYITEEELFGYLDQCVSIVMKKGESWTEYTYSFLIGRCLQGFDLYYVLEESKKLLNETGKTPEERVYQLIPFK